ncbi:MAG: DUF5011 domain-containing protein [Spirochaetales bacterium]|nr:DUF5011 domain-containing protein [Spirochaetales bacterium]
MKKINFLIFLLILLIFGCSDDGDKENPYIVLLKSGTTPTVTLNQGDTYVEPGFIAADNVDGKISSRVIVDDSELNVNVPGTYKIYYKVYDLSGNFSEVVERTVVVRATKGWIVLNQGESCFFTLGELAYDPGCIAYDIDGSIIDSVDSDFYEVVDTSVIGQYKVSYSFIDSNLNDVTAQLSVFVVLDSLKPVIILNGSGLSESKPFRAERGITDFSRVEPGYIAYDKKYGDISDSVLVDYSEIEGAKGDSYVLSYTLQNPDGVAADEVYRYVSLVDDATPPAVILNGSSEVNIEIGIDSYIEHGAKAFDKEVLLPTPPEIVINKVAGDEIISADITVFDMVNSVGAYEVVYTSIDTAGNVGSSVRRVFVVDTIFPSLTYLGTEVTANQVVTQNLPYGSDPLSIFPDPVCTDNDPNFRVSVTGVSRDSIDTRVVGSYSTTFVGIDPSGNSTPYFSRNVNILPPPNPVVNNWSFEDNPTEVGYLDTDSGLEIGWKWVNTDVMLQEGEWYSWASSWGDDGIYNYSGYGFQSVLAGEYMQAFCGLKSVAKHGVSSAWMAGETSTSAAVYDPVVGVIPINFANWYNRTVGKLVQRRVFVYKDVEYEASSWMMYRIWGENSPQDIIFSIKVDDDNTPGGMLFKQNNGNAVSVRLKGDISDLPEVWHQKKVRFTPDRDGYVLIEFQKTDVYGWGDDDGVETFVDNVRIIPVSY